MAIIFGTNLPNVLNGTDGYDYVSGLAGDDIINLGNFPDRALGGLGNDTINGQDFYDVLYGAEGNDILNGGSDSFNDVLVGDYFSGTTVSDIAFNVLGIRSFSVIYGDNSLQNAAEYTLANLRNSTQDLIIIPPIKSSTTSNSQLSTHVDWLASEITQIRAGGTEPKQLVAYLDIAKIADIQSGWLPSWTSSGRASGQLGQATTPSWLEGLDPGPTPTTSESHVRFVDFREVGWKQFLFSSVDRIIAQGFDGVFLDDVGSYFWAASHGISTIAESARAMRDLVIDLSVHIRQQVASVRGGVAAEQFRIIVNSNPFLINDAASDRTDIDQIKSDLFYNAIDAAIFESYFNTTNATAANLDTANRGIIVAVSEYFTRGIPLLSVDRNLLAGDSPTPLSSAQQQAIAAEATVAGFLPFVGAKAGFLTIEAPYSPAIIAETIGEDALSGGNGNDTYLINSTGDVIIELQNEGIDQVATILAVYQLPPNLENLRYLGTGNFVGLGTSLDNVITGGVGRDELQGRDGNDILLGGTGAANTLIGGLGDDLYFITAVGDSTVESTNEGRDEVRTAFSIYGLQNNVENLTAIDAARHGALVGNVLDNVITGNIGNDDLFGREGNDTLRGGSGAANTLLGQEGDDIYIVEAVGDSIIEFVNQGIDSVQTALASFVLRDHVENLIYTGTATFTGIGASGANTLTGGALDDFLSGLDGADILVGKSGADFLLGGAGADQYRYEGGETGFDRITDFVSGVDKIALRDAGFAQTATFALAQGGTPVATTTNSTFLYNINTGMLSFDADGSGAGAAVTLAQLNGGLTLAAGDFVFY